MPDLRGACAVDDTPALSEAVRTLVNDLLRRMEPAEALVLLATATGVMTKMVYAQPGRPPDAPTIEETCQWVGRYITGVTTSATIDVEPMVVLPEADTITH